MEAPKGVSASSCSSKKTVLSTSWMSKISNMAIRMSIGFADSSRIYAVLAPHTWIISVPAAPPYHLLSFALALHCLWAVTPNLMQEASYGYGLGNERLWIRAGMLSACSSRVIILLIGTWSCLLMFVYVTFAMSVVLWCQLLESRRWQLVSLASSQPTIQFSYQSLEEKGKKTRSWLFVASKQKEFQAISPFKAFLHHDIPESSNK